MTARSKGVRHVDGRGWPSTWRYLSDRERIRFHLGYFAGARDECWNWRKGHTESGHGAFYYGCLSVQAHVISFLLSGKLLTSVKNCVLHSCGNKLCVNPAHLRAGSPTENVCDAIAQGTRKYPRGHLHGNAKLTDGDVDEIIRIRNEHGKSYKHIGDEFGVTFSCIHLVVKGKAWKHVRRHS